MVAAPPPSPARAVYLSDGDELDYIPAADVVAGQIVVQNDLVGVVLHAAPAGERTALETFGLYAFPKPTGAGTA
ncbi:MAG: DUF2190 family protein, partial [Planctomycetota bacterium]